MIVDGIDIDHTGPRVRITRRGGGSDLPLEAVEDRAATQATGSRVSGVCRLATSRHGNRVKVVATAVDRAGNVTREKVTYRRS